MNRDDPLDVALSALGGGDFPVAPDPQFAARLRARLESAANLFAQQPDRTQGVTMSGTDSDIADLLTSTASIQHGDVGFVAVWTPDADRAAAFYGRVLGWTYDSATHRVTNTGQRIGIFPVADRHTLFCCYAVTDLAGARANILAGGGSVDDVEQFDFGAVLGATDPQGVEFAVYQPARDEPRPLLNGGGPGELSYITYLVPDSTAFTAFYGRVLSWDFEPGRVDDGWALLGTHPMAGAAGGNTEPVTVPMWTVEDIDAAVTRVHEAGGTVIEEPSQQSYGASALCTDDQGTRFYLGAF